MKTFKYLVIVSSIVILLWSVVYSHLCDNVFRQADKLIVKPESYNIIVKDETSFKMFLQNNMDRSIAEISLRAESQGFEFEITPDEMSIPRNKKVYFTVTMRTKPEVKTGTYPIFFRLVGDNRQYKSFSLDVKSEQDEQETSVKEEKADSKHGIISIVRIKSTVGKFKLDGSLEDDLWKESGSLSNFSSIIGGEAKYKTVILIAHDGINLYLGTYCLGYEDMEVSKKDRIEFRFAENASSADYYSINVPTSGKVKLKKISDSGDTKTWKDHDIRSALGSVKDHGISEVVVPLASIGIKKPAKLEGEKLYIRIIRIKSGREPEESYWAQDSSGYNKENGFGEVILAP